MATSQFLLETNGVSWDSTEVLASDFTIVAGQQFDLLVSDEIPNPPGGALFNSLKIVVDYEDIPSSVGSFSIGMVIESKNSLGKWAVIGVQNDPIRVNSQAPERIVVIQPNLDTFNSGIDEITYPLDKEETRISRHQGSVPEQPFRVRVFAVDSDPQGANAFVSVKVSGSGELYES